MAVVSSLETESAIGKAVALLRECDGIAALGVSELARRTELSKSTAFRVLQELVEHGFVEKDRHGYRLGPQAYEIGLRVQGRHVATLRDALTPYLADLYATTKSTVHLGILRGADVVYLLKLHGVQRVPGLSRVGGAAPAHCTALGKILLSFDDFGAELALERGLRRLTTRSIANADDLHRELGQVRVHGIAHDREEAESGLLCVAAPVFGPNGAPIAAMSVSGFAGTFNAARVEHALRATTDAASREMKRRIGPGSARPDATPSPFRSPEHESVGPSRASSTISTRSIDGS